MFEGSIVSYEDCQDISSGQAYTIYNISVEATHLGKKWLVTKRYKHFQYLYNALREEYPDHTELNELHFPRKSIFNTFSVQTKERRRKNFSKFITIALSIEPLPLCVEDFFEISDRCDNVAEGNHEKHSLPYSYSSPSKQDGVFRRKQKKDLPRQDSVDNIPDHIENKDNAVSDVLNEKDEKKKMTKILVTTFPITTLFYFAMIYIGFIDIEDTSLGRLALTALSLGSAISLMRISLIKRNIRKRQAFIREFKTALKAC